MNRPSTAQRFSGTRVLIAMFVGLMFGALVAFFLRTVIAQTPVDLQSQRLNLFFGMVTVSGALGALVVETMRQLQQSSPETEYRRRRRGLR